eukprot:3153148-Alexandrium_andersonii.AAC.1
MVQRSFRPLAARVGVREHSECRDGCVEAHNSLLLTSGRSHCLVLIQHRALQHDAWAFQVSFAQSAKDMESTTCTFSGDAKGGMHLLIQQNITSYMPKTCVQTLLRW